MKFNYHSDLKLLISRVQHYYFSTWAITVHTLVYLRMAYITVWGARTVSTCYYLSLLLVLPALSTSRVLYLSFLITDICTRLLSHLPGSLRDGISVCCRRIVNINSYPLMLPSFLGATDFQSLARLLLYLPDNCHRLLACRGMTWLFDKFWQFHVHNLLRQFYDSLS